MCHCSPYTEQAEQRAKIQRCCHNESQQTAKRFCEPSRLLNTPHSQNPFCPIHKHKHRKRPTGQTDAASMSLRSGMCNTLANKACLRKRSALPSVRVHSRNVFFCLQPSSGIHPQGTHMLNKNTRHALRNKSIHQCRIPPCLFA